MTKLYIIRHGETEWNKENRTQGCSNNLHLSEVGLKQAQLVAKRAASFEIDAIYCSDLIRAHETASELSKIIKLPVHTLPGLREMNFGCWEGLTFKEIREKYSDIYKVWCMTPCEAIIPDGETLMELKKRVLDAVESIMNQNKGKNIVIFSHGVCIKILILGILGIDISLYSRIRIDNTGISVIEYRDRGPVLTLFNDTCHLNGEVNP